MTDNYKNCGHPDSLNYACVSSQQLFCEMCFKKHIDSCKSTRCGNLKKLSLTLTKNIQLIKLKQKLFEAGADGNRILEFVNWLEGMTIKFTHHIIVNYS